MENDLIVFLDTATRKVCPTSEWGSSLLKVPLWLFPKKTLPMPKADETYREYRPKLIQALGVKHAPEIDKKYRIAEWAPSWWRVTHGILHQQARMGETITDPGIVTLFTQLPSCIPCLRCQRHLSVLYRSEEHAPPLNSNQSYQWEEWWIGVHNAVSASLGKPQLSLEQAERVIQTQAQSREPRLFFGRRRGLVGVVVAVFFLLLLVTFFVRRRWKRR